MNKFFFTCTAVISAFFAASSHANQQDAIQDYLNTLQTFQADFEQYVSGEDISYGTFTLGEKGKFAWVYTAPTTERIISTGLGVFYAEEEGGAITQVPTDGALYQFFVKDRFNLKHPNIHVNALRQNEDMMALDVSFMQEGEEIGKSILGFTKDPLQLKSFTNITPMGERVFVSLKNIKENPKVNNALFEIEKPFDY